MKATRNEDSTEQKGVEKREPAGNGTNQADGTIENPLSSLPPSLRAALAAREAAYRGSASPSPALAPAAAPAPPERSSERDGLAQRLAEASAERDRLTSEVERLRGEVARLTSELAAAQTQLREERSASEQLRRQCTEREARITALESEMKQLLARLQEPASAAAAAGGDAAPAAGGGSDAEARLAELTAKYRALVEESEKQRRKHASETATLNKQLYEARQRLEHRQAEYEKLLESVKERSAAPASRASSPAQVRLDDGDAAPRPTPRREAPHEPQEGTDLLIFDDEAVGQEASNDLARAGFPVSLVPTLPDSGSPLADRSPACVVLNLAAPQSWTAVRAIRAAEEHKHVPLVAYALAQQSATGFWFGPVDFLLLPIGKGIVEIAKRIAPGIKHAIILTSDSLVTTEVSENLAKGRVLSMSARDRRQALEAVRNAAPQLAVVHPGTTPVDGFRAVAALRDVHMLHSIPVLFLLDAVAEAREPALLSAAARTILRLGTLTANNLASSIAGAFRTLKPNFRPQPPKEKKD